MPNSISTVYFHAYMEAKFFVANAPTAAAFDCHTRRAQNFRRLYLKTRRGR